MPFPEVPRLLVQRYCPHFWHDIPVYTKHQQPLTSKVTSIWQIGVEFILCAVNAVRFQTWISPSFSQSKICPAAITGSLLESTLIIRKTEGELTTVTTFCPEHRQDPILSGQGI